MKIIIVVSMEYTFLSELRFLFPSIVFFPSVSSLSCLYYTYITTPCS